MSVVIVNREFNLPAATLSSVAERLLEALQDQTIGTPVVSRLSSTFVADFTAQIALVAKLDTDQNGATGSVGSLVQSQAEARAEVRRHLSVARRAARLAFRGQTTLLRADFQVGADAPSDIPAAVARGREVLAACQRSAAALESHGWVASSTDALQAAVEGLASLNRDRERTGDGKAGLTLGWTVAANQLYRQCLTVQNVARLVYSGRRLFADPAAAEARSRYLLGEFPRRPAPAAEPVPATPVASVPTPLAAAA